MITKEPMAVFENVTFATWSLGAKEKGNLCLGDLVDRGWLRKNYRSFGGGEDVDTEFYWIVNYPIEINGKFYNVGDEI